MKSRPPIHKGILPLYNQPELMVPDELVKLSYVPKDSGSPGKPYIINGNPVTIAQASRRLGVSKKSIHGRLNRGVPPEIALTVKRLPKDWKDKL